MSEWIPIACLILTTVAVVAGPIVSYRIAKRQILASVVSANRQKWIDELRSDLAELIVALELSAFESISRTNLEISLKDFSLTSARIDLRLRLGEDTHDTLRDALGRAFEVFNVIMQDGMDDEIQKLRKQVKAEITTAAHEIFNQEHELMRQGK